MYFKPGLISYIQPLKVGIICCFKAHYHAKGDNIEEIDSDSDDDQLEAVPPSLKEVIDACQVLEEGSLLICTGVLDFIEAGP